MDVPCSLRSPLLNVDPQPFCFWLCTLLHPPHPNPVLCVMFSVAPALWGGDRHFSVALQKWALQHLSPWATAPLGDSPAVRALRHRCQKAFAVTAGTFPQHLPPARHGLGGFYVFIQRVLRGSSLKRVLLCPQRADEAEAWSYCQGQGLPQLVLS